MLKCMKQMEACLCNTGFFQIGDEQSKKEKGKSHLVEEKQECKEYL